MNKWLNKKLDKKRRTGQGFTLIELIVVVTVLGILAAIVIYAVGNIQGSANKAAAGTSQSEVNTAEQDYCQQNGQYGTAPQLVNAGLLTNPDPSLNIYVNSIPQNAQLYQACGTSVYDAYPQTITQPDGSSAVIASPPSSTKVVLIDQAGPPAEELAALGVMPAGGLVQPPSDQTADEVYGPLAIVPLVNTANYVNLGSGPNVQQVAAAKPSLIVGTQGNESSTPQWEAIAPVLDINQNALLPTSPNQPTATPPAGDPSALPWFQELLMLGQIMNLQVEAAAFVTAFENAAASYIPSLAGKSVSFIFPLGTTASPGSVVVESPSQDLSKFLAFLGMTVDYCPGCTGVSTSFQLQNFTAADAPGTYLLVGTTSTANTSYAQGLLASGGALAGLPQVAAGTVWGPSQKPAFGPVSATPGLPGAATPALPSPLSGYCSIAGVSVSAAGTSAGTLCPGYTAATTPAYQPVTLPLGVWGSGGPITDLAAMSYIPADF